MVVLAIPVVVALLLLWTADRWRGRTRHVPWERQRPWVLALVTLLIAFAVFRNTAAGAWFAP